MNIDVGSPYLVPHDGSFRIAAAPTAPPDGAPGRKEARAVRRDHTDAIADLQEALYAHDRYSILLVFQAMDAAGKDSTIRAVLTGVNPSGCQVFSFKAPSKEELDHDFLWRTAQRLPERGRIGIFNRSYYEEVLVVRVIRGILAGQRLPHIDREQVWDQRLASIRDHELHLARNGTAIVKFFLNVSKQEQANRIVARIDDPRKNWKFAPGDLDQRPHWAAYMAAYEAALNATSRPWAPWYAIPADDKSYMRMVVADIVRRTLESLHLTYPTLTDDQVSEMLALREELVSGRV